MRLKGRFVVRQIMGDVIAIPVGDPSRSFNGMICLNEVGGQILEGLQARQTREQILQQLLEQFDVAPEEAAADLDEFLAQLGQSGLLED